MRPEEKFSMRLLAVGIPAFFAALGVFVSFGLGGTPGQGVLIGFIVGLLVDAIYIPFMALYLVRLENRQGTAKASDTQGAAEDTELSRQIKDIVNSGNEPALIVEEMRRLTEVRP